MNVDLIKFVDDDNFMTIYSANEWWQYIHSFYRLDLTNKEIFLIECFGERIIQPNIYDLTDVIETLLNHPHQARVVDMIRYMKGKKK